MEMMLWRMEVQFNLLYMGIKYSQKHRLWNLHESSPFLSLVAFSLLLRTSSVVLIVDRLFVQEDIDGHHDSHWQCFL